MSEYRHTMQIRLSDPLQRLLVGESVRTLKTPSQVAADILAAAIPDYLAREARQALAPPIEVEARSREHRSQEAVA